MTVATQFKRSLGELMTKMISATPQFVRCIKSNARLQPATFDGDLVRKQLECVGVATWAWLGVVSRLSCLPAFQAGCLGALPASVNA